MPTLTVFTPAYNRSHTIGRTYESLCRQTCRDFEWLIIDDGSTDGTRELVQSWLQPPLAPHETKGNSFSGLCPAGFKIRYAYKENGGLHTGYNKAIELMETELCVCIDSDDWMPDDAVEKILNCWGEKGSDKVAGIIGLDYYSDSKQPIGGRFPNNLLQTHLLDLSLRNLHSGDTKQVMRTQLMKSVAPQIGFPGEKNFNPVYMLLQIDENYPLIVLNENLCYVEYQQDDSMSRAIYHQYLNSPRSFAKLRLLEMQLKHNTWRNKFRSAIHYVSSCIIAHDKDWLRNAPSKTLVLAATPLGLILYCLIRYKTR